MAHARREGNVLASTGCLIHIIYICFVPIGGQSARAFHSTGHKQTRVKHTFYGDILRSLTTPYAAHSAHMFIVRRAAYSSQLPMILDSHISILRIYFLQREVQSRGHIDIENSNMLLLPLPIWQLLTKLLCSRTNRYYYQITELNWNRGAGG